MALMASAFVALTIVLIVFQPGSPRHASVEPLPATSVTRVAPALDDLAPPITEVVTASPSTTDRGTSLIGPTTPAAATSTTTMPTNMRDMTFVAISNLKSATTGEAPAPGEPGSLLHSVVQRSLGTAPATQTEINPADQVTSPRIPAIQTPASRSYFVRPGDTLVSIAQELYGDVNKASELFLINGAILNRPDDLRAGMVLELP